MPTKAPLIDTRTIDVERVAYGIEEIRARNEHRFEMEQLTGVLRVDPATHSIVGFKRYAPDEFWVRGHIPGRPILPGVLMLEAAAQLGTFYCKVVHPEKAGFWALAGVDAVRYRGAVEPGQTLVIAEVMREVRSRLMRFEFQGFVGDKMVVEGVITGMLV